MTEKTHWLSSPNKNYLGYFDLPNGNDLVLTIKSAGHKEVVDPVSRKSETHKVVEFEEDFKPMICNMTNSQSIMESTGESFVEDCIGKRIQLFVGEFKDRQTKKTIGCLRVRSQTPKEKEILEEGHQKWEKAKESVLSGKIDIMGLRRHYDISIDNFQKLKK